MTPSEIKEEFRKTLAESKIPKSTVLKNVFNAFDEKEIIDIFNAITKGKHKETVAKELTELKTATGLFEVLEYSELEAIEKVIEASKESKKANEIKDTKKKMEALATKLKALEA